MANFKIAHSLTSVTEAGYQAYKEDSGNYFNGKLIGTNRGISAPVLAAYLKRAPTVEEMKLLSKETADEIFRINYWNVIRGDLWNSQDNANSVYDMAVNSGCSTSIKLWQKVIGVKETGEMDNLTLSKTNLI